MIQFLRKTHRLLYFASVLIFFTPFYPILWLMARDPSKFYNQIVVLRRWISILSLYAVGIRIKVTYETNIDWARNYVICPNHASFLDISVLTYLCPIPFSFIGKIELLKNIVTRIFFQTIDIAVDRSSRISSVKGLRRGNELLKEGKSIVIFPEGKIDDEFPPRLHPFKSGPFRMAIDNDIPLLPVVIHDAWKLMWDDGKAFGSKPGIIHVTVLAPIETYKDPQTKHTTFEQEVYHKMIEILQYE